MVRPPLSFVIFIICVLFCRLEGLCANIFPAEGATVNYRIIGFSFGQDTATTHYTIQIAAGNITDASRFKPEIIASAQEPRIMATVPAFGKSYTWRVIYLDGKKTKVSPLHHFSTGKLPEGSTTNARLNVTLNTVRELFYIMDEGASAIYDETGKPVWYLPATAGLHNISDLKCTPQHTLTFLSAGNAFEIDVTGKVLWRSPDMNSTRSKTDNTDSVMLHHEFWRLANGHYMALASEANAANPAPSAGTANHQNVQHFFPSASMSALYEFDSDGKVVWQWHSADYFSHTEHASMEKRLFNRLLSQGMSGHENAFYFDEKQQEIYLSFAEFNRILRISYPSGEVINSFGASYDPMRQTDSAMSATGPFKNLLRASVFNNSQFSGQHSCRLTADGNLLLYDNHMHDTTSLPEVQLYKVPGKGEPGVLEELWAFQCPAAGREKARKNSGGGCVNEMNDGSIFVSMNFPYGEIFIVNKDKKITWMALTEKKGETGKWESLQSYRTSVISKEALEELIWHGEGINGEQTMESKKGGVLSSQ